MYYQFQYQEAMIFSFWKNEKGREGGREYFDEIISFHQLFLFHSFCHISLTNDKSNSPSCQKPHILKTPSKSPKGILIIFPIQTYIIFILHHNIKFWNHISPFTKTPKTKIYTCLVKHHQRSSCLYNGNHDC